MLETTLRVFLETLYARLRDAYGTRARLEWDQSNSWNSTSTTLTLTVRIIDSGPIYTITPGTLDHLRRPPQWWGWQLTLDALHLPRTIEEAGLMAHCWADRVAYAAREAGIYPNYRVADHDGMTFVVTREGAWRTAI